MRIQITARHTDVSEAVRDRTEARVGRLVRYQPRLGSAEVVFEEERHLKKVEAVLHVDGAPAVVARGQAEDFRRALDKTVDRLQRILREQRSRRTDHQSHPLSARPPADPPRLAAD